VGRTNTRLERTSMITSPSRNEKATTFVHLHNTDVPVKAVKVSPAPTAQPLKGRKEPLNARFPHIQFAVGTCGSGR
jgi:hypothetical protein